MKLVAAAVVAILCLIWFVPWAYIRMTTPPARAHDDLSDWLQQVYSAPDGDATDEWQALLASKPPWPTFDEPPPAGMKWQSESGGPPHLVSSEMSSGEWDPAARPTLRVQIRHISSQAVTVFLASATNLRERPWVWDYGTAGAPAGVNSREIRGVSRLFVARSRYRLAEQHDVYGAWEDLKTMLVLSRTGTRNLLIHTLMLGAHEDLAIRELWHLLREVTIDEKISLDIQATLSTLPSFELVWRKAIEAQLQDDLNEMDRLFADDGNGNGWLVLGVQPDAESLRWSDWPKPAADRSGLWNLLSFLYHDRRTVEARVRRHWSQRLEAGLQPYAAAVRALSALDAHPLFGPADGPWLHALEREGRVGMKILLQGQISAIAKRRSVQIMAAVSRFRDERGHYPVRLDELAPHFVSLLPVDPFCGDSFAYKRVGDEDYVLYSCGYDGVDDGGRARKRGGDGRWDFVYTKPRNDPYTKEPVAVPLDADDPKSGWSDWNKP